MERVCLTLFLMCAYATSVYSQLEVNYSGKVGVGVTNEILEDEEEDSIMSPLSVCSAGDNNSVGYIGNAGRYTALTIDGYRGGNNSINGLWLRSGAHGGNATGIKCYGLADFEEDNSIIGVQAITFGGHNSASVLGGPLMDNFYSEIDDENYAGIYGSIYKCYPFFQYPGQYAGYFDGPVRATGPMYAQAYYTAATSSLNSKKSGSVVPSALEAKERVSDLFKSVSTIELQHNEMPLRLNKTNLAEKFLEGRNIQQLSKKELLQLDSICTRIPSEKMDPLSSVNYGLDAEQLKSVFPKLVQQDKEGNYSINYIEIIPLLVKSINELSEELAQLKGENRKFVRKAKSEATGIEENVSDIDMVRMDQNKPNPFDESTVIGLNVPENAQKANIFIYDLSGKQIQNVTVAERGETNITVYASDLGTGMYIYTLVVDGNVVVTRRMIVSE